MRVKFAVILDGNGNFGMEDISNRMKTFQLLKEIQDGDYLANYDEGPEILDDIIDNDEKVEEWLSTLPVKEWLDFLAGLQQRGTMELIDMEIKI